MDLGAATVKLTDLASCGGCAAKYSAARLEELLRGFVPVESDERFVVYRPDSGYRTVEPDIRPESRPSPRESADVTAGSRSE